MMRIHYKEEVLIVLIAGAYTLHPSRSPPSSLTRDKLSDLPIKNRQSVFLPCGELIIAKAGRVDTTR